MAEQARSSPWHLVKNQDEFEAFVKQCFDSLGVDVDLAEQVKQSPAVYPAMVNAMSPAFGRLIFCAVYPEDAAALLRVSGWPNQTTTPAFSPAAIAISHNDLPAMPHRVKPEAAVTQDDANRDITAHLWTLVNLLISRGLISANAYEQQLAVNRGAVDQVMMHKLEMIRKAMDNTDLIIGTLPR